MLDHDRTDFTPKDRVLIHLEEFRTYRTEILANQDAYIKIFTIAATAVGALMAVLFGKGTPDTARIVISFFAALILSIAIAIIYALLVHTENIARYIRITELRINDLAGTEMDWEIEQKRAVRRSLSEKIFYPRSN